ncbi:MAG: gliding motility-associated C-terminal domain-containing protein, partial [Flavobacteriales bacterium]
VSKNGCTSYDTIEVIFHEIPEINLGDEVELCAGDSTTFNAFYNADASYLWQDGSTNQTYTSNSTELVWVEVTLNNCSFTDSVDVTVYPIPVIDLDDQYEICFGDSIIIDGFYSEGADYLWSTGDTNAEITLTEAGNYAVQISEFGCSYTETFFLIVHDLPKSPNLADGEICLGESHVFNAYHDDNISYTWSTGASTSSIKATSEGWYWVDIQNDNCQVRDSVFLTINLAPSFNFPVDTFLCETKPILLDVSSDGGTYLWNDGSTEGQKSIETVGVYWVHVINACGERSDTIRVYPKDCGCNVYTPNAIIYSSSTESGEFLPKSDCNFSLYTLQIYNRWGKLVFQTEDETESWRPREKSTDNQQDNYIYILKYGEDNEQIKTKTGSIILLK